MKDTDADLIDRLGGTEAVAQAMGVKVERVKKWRQRGVPWAKRAAFQQAARALKKRLPADFLTVPRVKGSEPEREAA